MPYGWLLQLRGLKARGTMTSAAFQAWTADKLVKRAIVDDNKTPEDPSDDLTYTGVALWRLVGRIDDARPASFNWKLATTAPGYNVVVTGVDGFSATYTSAEVATLKNKLVVANRVNGAPLNLGTASIKNPMTVDEVASWKPNWPLKLVSSDPGIFGSRKPAGVARISIVPAEAGERAADTGVPYGWLLQLRGLKARGTMTNAAFQAWTADKLVRRAIVDDNKTPEDPSDDLTYTGVALWRLVGRIDDARPASFNWKLATTAPGYNVVVTGVDGFSATYTSAEVATLKNKLVVANRVNGAPLNLGTASIKNPMTVDEVASWKPNWPLKLVSSDPGIFGSRKPAAVARISIVPAEAGTTLPFEQGVSEETPALEATSTDDPPEGGWTLTLRGRLHQGPAHREGAGHGRLGRHQGGGHQPLAALRLQGAVTVQAARPRGRPTARVVQSRQGQEGLHDRIRLPRRLPAEDLQPADPEERQAARTLDHRQDEGRQAAGGRGGPVPLRRGPSDHAAVQQQAVRLRGHQDTAQVLSRGRPSRAVRRGVSRPFSPPRRRRAHTLVRE